MAICKRLVGFLQERCKHSPLPIHHKSSGGTGREPGQGELKERTMIKKIATGMLAVAATTAIAMSLPASASASTSSATSSSSGYEDWWGPYYSKYGLAKARGYINVEWDEYGETNSTYVKGRLYDLDDRTYHEGGKCALVKFQVAYLEDYNDGYDYDYEHVYQKKYCGYPGYKTFYFEDDDVASVRVKVCQTDKYGYQSKKCGKWNYLYTYEVN